MSNLYTIWNGLSNKLSGFGDVVCFVPLVGYYGFRHGEVVKVQPRRFNSSGSLQSGRTFEPASKDDLDDLQKAIDMGIPSLIFHPYYGADDPEILMYGTGKSGRDPVYKRGPVSSEELKS